MENMPNGWIETTLGEVCFGKGEYGIGASAVDYSSSLFTYLRITDIKDDGTLDKKNLKSVDDNNAHKYILQPNDIVFARTGASTGRNYFYDGSDGEFVYAGFLIKFSINPSKVNPKYLKYYCLSEDYCNWISAFNSGSTRGNINANTLSSLNILLPPRNQQDFLVKILSSLDDKIELNNKINKNLEEQAQAIFKSWFVDFEPFGGVMPSDWKEGFLKDLMILKYGKDHKQLLDGIYPVYGSGGIMRYVNNFLYNKESVLIPRKGTLNNILYVNEAFWSVDTMFYTEMKYKNLAQFVFQFLKRKNFTLMNVGSAVPSMTTHVLNNIKLMIPSQNTLTEFDTIVSKLYHFIQLKKKENQNLATLRDTLLPKLMSGEMRV